MLKVELVDESPTEVTVPLPFPLNVVQSADERHPACEPDATWHAIVVFVPPISAPSVPVVVNGLLKVTDVVAVLYILPPDVEFTVPAPRVENIGELVKVCVPAHVFEVVVPKAKENCASEELCVYTTGYKADKDDVPKVELPPPLPQSLPVPSTTPLTSWRH